MDRRLPALAPLSAAVRPIAFDLMAARRQMSIDLDAEVLMVYSPEEIEAIARSLGAGYQRLAPRQTPRSRPSRSGARSEHHDEIS